MGKIEESIKPMNNIGRLYIDCYGNNKKAMKYYIEALKTAEKHRIFYMEMNLLNNIGENYIDLCEYDEAVYYIERAKVMAIDMEDSNAIFSTNINLGLIYTDRRI